MFPGKMYFGNRGMIWQKYCTASNMKLRENIFKYDYKSRLTSKTGFTSTNVETAIYR